YQQRRLGCDCASHARTVGGRRVLAHRLRAWCWPGRAAVSALGAGERGMSWLGPRSRSLNHWIARAVSSGLSRLAALTVSLGAWLIGTIKGQIKTLATRWREGPARPAAALQPSLHPHR